MAQGRLWEVDCCRGLAVAMMLLSNFVFDFTIFGSFRLQESLFWPAFARVTAALFLLLAGVSLVLSFSTPQARRQGFSKVARRGGKIFSLGLLITIVTWFAVGRQLVLFGILHLIGLGIMLAYPFLGRRYTALVGGVAAALGGIWAGRVILPWPWLVWLGFRYPGFASVDYTPILPWFSFILFGVFIGESLFREGMPLFRRGDWGRTPAVRGLTMLGRHSLLIYLGHQPLFWAGFWLWERVGS